MPSPPSTRCGDPDGGDRGTGRPEGGGHLSGPVLCGGWTTHSADSEVFRCVYSLQWTKIK